MKVKELIAKLQKFDQEQTVLLYVEERDCERAIDRVKELDVVIRYDRETNKAITEKCVVLD